MTDERLVIDVWEGSLEINEKTLKDNDIDGIIVRLNDMNGGHHRDAGFDKQWAEAENFLRGPYFVYNPWVDGVANYDWMMRNLPSTPVIFPDVEVKYPNYSPVIYATEVSKYLTLCQPNFNKIHPYTGPWFLPFLSSWRKDFSYWWGRYPNAVYPAGSEYWTWEKFRSVVATLPWTVQLTEVGPIELWQCTADRLILPGTVRTLDVSIWRKSKEELANWFGQPYTLEQRVVRLEADMKLVKARLGI